MNAKRRFSLVLLAMVTAGLVWFGAPASAGAPVPSVTKIECSPRSATSPPDQELGCVGIVADADPGVDVDPMGVVEFYNDLINTPAFIGRCTLTTMGGPGGLSACALPTLAVSPGVHTIWGVYQPVGSPYSGSQSSDDVGNPPSGPPDPTDTSVLCVPAGPAAPGVPLNCAAAVADDDNDISPALRGTVEFSKGGVVGGSCKLVILGPGLSLCRSATTPVPVGANTIDATFMPGNAAYATSSDSYTLTV